MIKKLNQYIDHTLLKPDATDAAIEKLCAEAAQYDFASVCVNPVHVALAKRLLSGTDVKVCTVIGFPLGASMPECKAYETAKAYADGCDEFDMVINIGKLKSKAYDFVKNDISGVVAAAKGKTVKVIIETLYLTEEEKIMACRLSSAAGAAFVKTCTGFNAGKAEESDVSLMKKSVPPDMRVKASAGIRCYEDAVKMIAAGADRIGTSAGVAIISSENGEHA